MGREIFWWRHAIQRGGDGNNEDVARAAHELIKRGEPLGYQILMRGEGVIRQCFPIGQQARAKFRCEEGNFFQQPLCIERTGRDYNDGLGLLCQLGEGERITGAIEMAISNRGARGRDGQLERHRLRYDRKCAANPRVWGGTLKKIDIICQYPHKSWGEKLFAFLQTADLVLDVGLYIGRRPMVHDELQGRVAIELIHLQSVNGINYLW